mmetsp:Transcript_70027/g.193707  ORF Transcript_70027/g.193707 Transcript_70027/m.193707 type:complete len:249 (-) Transcript_70027:78-824(-)
MPTGVLKRWLGDKGFGFITPDDGSGDLFAHIRQKGGAVDEAITEGRRVTFESEVDMQRGKPKATSWAFVGGSHPSAPGPGATVSPAAVAQIASASGVDYQALVQAANAATAAIAAAGSGGQAAGNNLLANLAGLAGGLAGGAAPVQVPAPAGPVTTPPPVPAALPPPPPAPIKHAQEEVEVPSQLVPQIWGQAGAGLEEIKKRAGGDIIIELAGSEVTPGTRTLRIRGPAVSASLGACLVLQRMNEVI